MMKDAGRLDLSYLKGISKGNTGFELKMLHTFIEQVNEEMGKLRKYLEEKDWESLYSCVHKIKPSFQFIGAGESGRLILDLEENLREKKNLGQVPFIVDSFMDSCARDVEAVHEEIGKYTAGTMR